MALNGLDAGKAGSLAEQAAIAILIEGGWEVFRNATTTGPADLIVWNRRLGILRLIDVKIITGYRNRVIPNDKDDRICYLYMIPSGTKFDGFYLL